MQELFFQFGMYFQYMIILIAGIAFLKSNIAVLYSLYVFTYMQTNLFTKVGEAGTFFEPHIMIGFLIIVYFMLNRRYLEKYSKLSKLQRTIINFILFIFIFKIVLDIKSYLLLFDALMSWKTYIKSIIGLLAIIFFTSSINKLNLKKYVYYGLIFNCVFIAMQCIFSYTQGIDLNNRYYHEGTRILGNLKMDPNELSAVFIITISFCALKLNERKDKILLIISMLVIFAAVLLTGSRSGFLASFLILVQIFIAKKKYRHDLIKIESIVFIIVIFVTGYYTFLLLGETVLKRLYSQEMTENVRVLRYPEYVKFFANNPLYIVTGALSKIEYFYSYNRVAHNLYIQSIYNLGIFYLLFYLRYIYRIIRFNVILKSNFSIFFPVIFFLAFGMTLSNPPLGNLLYIIALSIPTNQTGGRKSTALLGTERINYVSPGSAHKESLYEHIKRIY